MKTNPLICVAIAALAAPIALAQLVPGAPEDNGLIPKTETIFIHTPETPFNNDLEQSLGVGITDNGNIIVGWEDDGPDDTSVTYMSAVWTMFNPLGASIIPDTEVNSSVTSGGPINTRFLSYFRNDGSAVPGNTSWGPKIKANLFGSGAGMGATSFSLGAEVPDFAAINTEEGGGPGDFPSVQIVNSSGQPVRIVSGVSEAHAETAGDIRIADFDFLANGNIVITGESRQESDIVDKFGGEVPTRHAIYRVVDANGNEVRQVSLVSETHDRVELWHGIGVTRNGFAIRFSVNGQTQIRRFDNAGVPVSGNIDLATLTEKPINAGGGRGDSTGFHGNGNDAYVYIVSGTDENAVRQVWLTVINADGTLRYTKAVTEPELELLSPGRVDAAIDEQGRVLAVFSDTSPTQGAASIVLGRVFDRTGAPLGGTFHVSEREIPDPATLASRGPRAAWRQNLAVVAWETRNHDFGTDLDGDSFPDRLMAMRLFSTFTPGSAESAGLTRIIPDTPVNLPPTDNKNNWEPYTSVLGNSIFLIEANSFAKDDTGGDNLDKQRYVVVAQPVDGSKPAKLNEGFYADNGTAYDKQINGSRQDGNPGRVAGDKRPGAVNYAVGGEASPHAIPEFRTDNRWDLGFDRLGTSLAEDPDVGRYGIIQTFSLNQGNLTPTPLMKAIDSANFAETSGAAPNTQVTRFGGELAVLDNGNIVSVVEDRSNVRAAGNCATATIIAPDGAVIKAPWKVADGDLWSNVAAYKGGFAVRVQGIIYFHDNAGNLKGQVDQNASGESGFDRGRGDGTRIASHINTPLVFLAGIAGGRPKVAAFDSRDFSAAGLFSVDEAGLAGAWDRIGLAVDALNRIVVTGEIRPTVPVAYEQVQVVARVLSYDSTAKTFSALTPNFFAFINNSPTGIRTIRVNPSITTKQILIAAKGEINLENKPELGPNSPAQINFYTVLSHPDPKNDPTPAVGGGGGDGRLSISRSAANVTITWTGDGFTLQSAPAVTGSWSNITTTGNTHSAAIGAANAFFRLFKQQ